MLGINNLTRKQIVIVAVLGFVIVIIIIVNVFLYFKYRERQSEIQGQAKIAQDIQRVQQDIAAGFLGQMESAEIDQYIDQLKTEGVADEAITIAEEEKSRMEQERPLTEEEKLEKEISELTSEEKKMVNIIKNVNNTVVQISDIHQQLISLGETAIPSLKRLTDSTDMQIRYSSYSALFYFVYNNENLKQELIPFFKKGITDNDLTIKVTTAATLVFLGEKEGIPILIDNIDSPYPMTYAHNYFSFYCRDVLKDATGQDFNYNKKAWLDWWAGNKDKLIWDNIEKRFKIKRN